MGTCQRRDFRRLSPDAWGVADAGVYFPPLSPLILGFQDNLPVCSCRAWPGFTGEATETGTASEAVAPTDLVVGATASPGGTHDQEEGTSGLIGPA